jgi:hypothetical protein
MYICGSNGLPVTAIINSSPLPYSEPSLWICSFNHNFKGEKFPFAIDSSRFGILSLTLLEKYLFLVTYYIIFYIYNHTPTYLAHSYI